MGLFRRRAANDVPSCTEEASNLGAILISLGYVSRSVLEQRAKEQSEMSRDELLGRLLVAKGELDPGHLREALEIQRKLRSKRCHVRAMAQARLAELTTQRTVALARELRRDAAKVRRESSGLGYPAIGTSAATALLKAEGHG